MIEFIRMLTDEESAESDRLYQQSLAEYQEHKRLVEACPGHEWELDLELDDEVGGNASLRCTRCPANVDDVYQDGHDMVYMETDEGVTVEAGRHLLSEPAIVPVTVEVWSSKSWTDYGWDYDAGLEVEQRGPVRWLS